MSSNRPHFRRLRLAGHAGLFVLGSAVLSSAGLGACSSSSSPPAPQEATADAAIATQPVVVATADTLSTGANTTPGPAPAEAAPATSAAPREGGPVLPVADNPIANRATAATLHVDSVSVENNVDASGKAIDDHLEILLSNSGATALGDLEVFYTFSDRSTGVSESYYARLPATFTVPAAGSRVAHFDATGAPDHFAVSKFSLYYTDPNELDVTVVVSAGGAAVQTTTLKKDAGGAEAAD